MKIQTLKSGRNGKLDLLKFIFSVVIVIHHGKNVADHQYWFSAGGSFAVEFFFIVSGVLLMASIRKKSQAPPSALGTETLRFILKKVKGFCPEIFVAYAVALVVYNAATEIPLADLFIRSFYEGILLRMTGINATSINPAVWYISSMLLCMAVIYPMIRKFPDLSVKLILPLTALLLLGWFGGNMTSPRNPTEWFGLTYRGNLRAFAELSIGVCCFGICERLRKIDFTKAGIWFITIIEYACYGAVLFYMFFFNASRRDYFFILIYAIAIIITFSEKTADKRFFNNKLCYFLGKYSFSLYLSHSFWSTCFNKLIFAEMSNAEKMLVYMALSFATGFFVMLVSDFIRKYHKKVLAPLKKLFVIPPAD